jgi:ribosomal protein S12 methylthiotransferase
MVSLGCAKNQINSEQMLWLLDQAGYRITAELSDMDAVVINTCGFIESAKSEAIETILEFAALKKEGKLKKIIVAGCLPQRYGAETRKELPRSTDWWGAAALMRSVRRLKWPLQVRSHVCFQISAHRFRRPTESCLPGRAGHI